MADQNEVQWWAYLIGKIREQELSVENQTRLDGERAVEEAQHIIGEVSVKEAWLRITGGEEE